MKTIYNLVFKSSFVISIAFGVSSVAMPVLGYANANTTTTLGASSKISPFCSALSSKSSAITTQIATDVTKVHDAWAQEDQKMSAAYQKVDMTVATDRQKADVERQADLVTLQTKASTATQKKAVQIYESSVQTAVATRRAAFDLSRHTFRADVQTSLASRRAIVSAQLQNFQASVSSAISSAQTACTASPNNGPAVRLQLQLSLKTAREAYQADRKNDTKVRSQVQQLAATRDAAFKTAEASFQASLATARQTLQVAFGKNAV